MFATNGYSHQTSIGLKTDSSWWRQQMETFFSAHLALCAGNSPVLGEFPAQRPVTRSFDVLFDLCLNKRLSKQSWGWWFETPSRPLWRHRNVFAELPFVGEFQIIGVTQFPNNSPKMCYQIWWLFDLVSECFVGINILLYMNRVAYPADLCHNTWYMCKTFNAAHYMNGAGN